MRVGFCFSRTFLILREKSLSGVRVNCCCLYIKSGEALGAPMSMEHLCMVKKERVLCCMSMVLGEHTLVMMEYWRIAC